MTEKFTFFWHGPFSQWHPCEFEINGVTYSCSEQFMMAEKARLFDDTETLEKILASRNPKEQKSLGRKVRNFDQKVWEEDAQNIVFYGNMAKFEQNKDMKKLLLATDGTTLVEASPYDKIWGIGLRETNPKALKRETWCGLNWLGETLTKVRKAMMEL